MQLTIRFTLDAEEVPSFLKAAEDIFHDDGRLSDAHEEATSDESVFTIEGNTSVIFALGQAYQATELQGLVEYEVL